MGERSPSRLEAVTRGVNCRTSSDAYARTCLAALGVFPRPGPLHEVLGWATGWDPVDADEAVHAARRGEIVVAVHGRDVAVVLPSREGDGEVWLAQGGPAANHRAPLVAAFGLSRPEFWRHY